MNEDMRDVMNFMEVLCWAMIAFVLFYNALYSFELWFEYSVMLALLAISFIIKTHHD